MRGAGRGQSYTAIAEWAHDLSPTVGLRLGLGRRAPGEFTIRRLLQRVDAEHLDRVGAWLAACSRPWGALPVIAIDGKSVRGARCAGKRAVHLLAALHTGSGAVLGQPVLDGKTNEISAFGPLLDRTISPGRSPRAEALTRLSPADLGRLLGLDRAPEVKTLRRKLAELAAHGKAAQLQAALGAHHARVRPDTVGFLYLDGHVRVYSGTRQLPKTHIARMRLAGPATEETWVGDATVTRCWC